MRGRLARQAACLFGASLGSRPCFQLPLEAPQALSGCEQGSSALRRSGGLSAALAPSRWFPDAPPRRSRLRVLAQSEAEGWRRMQRPAYNVWHLSREENGRGWRIPTRRRMTIVRKFSAWLLFLVGCPKSREAIHRRYGGCCSAGHALLGSKP